MASEDVIEVVSSDDEIAPAPKRPKNLPNAMVHIPEKISVLTKNLQINKNLSVKKLSRMVPKVPVKSAMNIGDLTPSNTQAAKSKILRNPIPVKISNVINPISVMRAMNKNQPIQIRNFPTTSASPRILNSQKILNKLPPNITITKTNNTTKVKRKLPLPQVVVKKQRVNPLTATVQIDDDDEDDCTERMTPLPQWYQKPDDLTKEEENNKEPEPSKLNEIVIEDSPVKRISSLSNAIVIEDSPGKLNNEAVDAGSSDSERVPEPRTPNSKKKLHYPKEVHEPSTAENPQMKDDSTTVIKLTEPIEIEIEAFEQSSAKVSVETNDAASVNTKNMDDIVDITESPMKKTDTQEQVQQADVDNNNPREFHPVYQNFIDFCFELENSNDMKKIVEKKIKPYYKQVPKEYTESEEFLEMVTSKILSMQACPEKMYLYIKDIVDELKLQRNIAKSQAIENEKQKEAEALEFYGENVEKDEKRRRQVWKLEKTLKKLHRSIQKLEEQEVDFDDDGDSVYVLTESDGEEPSDKKSDVVMKKDRESLLQRYKERLIRVHAKLCQLTNTKMPSEPKLHIDARPGRPTGPARLLEKWVNRKVPAGAPLPFPDFHDVIKCVRQANEEDNLRWNEADIMEEARDLFTRCGKKLQRRRQENEWRIASSRLKVDVDPAESNQELKENLEENKKVAFQKEVDLIDKYADKQQNLNLEAEEIGDKEAEESPVESDDEAKDDVETVVKSSDRDKETIKEKNNDMSQDNKKLDVEEIVTTVKPNEEINNSVPENVDSIKEVSYEVPLLEAEPSLEQSDEQSSKLDKSTDKSIGNSSTAESKNMSVTESVNISSDDSKKLESDVDELHLLKILHSGSEVHSTQESTQETSDTDNTIVATDTLESSEDVHAKKTSHSSDVVSIENSSYSETEIADRPIEDVTQVKEVVNKECLETTEVQQVKLQNRESKSHDNNEEYSERLEDILLASSEEDSNQSSKESKCKQKNKLSNGQCVNLQDDAISISDVVIENTTVSVDDDKNQVCEDDNGKENDKISVITLQDESSKGTQEDLLDTHTLSTDSKTADESSVELPEVISSTDGSKSNEKISDVEITVPELNDRIDSEHISISNATEQEIQSNV